MNLFYLLESSARRHASAPAVFSGTELIWDYATLAHRARSLAAGLSAYGQAGDRVMIAAENCPEYVELLFGIWAAGQVVVPVNAKLHPREIADIVADCDPIFIFTSPKIAETLPADTRIVPIGSQRYLAMFAEPASDAVIERAPDDLAWLFFTSGTTGRSKGAMLSHRNLSAMTLSHLADFEDIVSDHSQIHGAPMSHGSGLYILPYIARGARQVIPASRRFDAAEFLDLSDHHPGAGAFLAPTMVRRLCVEVERGRSAPRGLRTIVYGGGPMYLADLKRALWLFGPIFRQLYGQGEAPMTITGLRRDDHIDADDDVLGSVGWPRSGVEVAIFDSEDRPVPAGEVGEIVCRGDIVMQGYWNAPDASATALRAGWLHTGDLGSLDADGKLVLRDRSKDVIISGGSNIYPREVEDALLTCPGIAEACIVGIADPEWGETVLAAVVSDGRETLTPALIDAHLATRIARFKHPKRYVFLPELPKSSYGKVMKREVQRLYS